MARTQSVVPQLRMLSAQASMPFYLDTLGFVVDWEHRFDAGMPLFAQLTRAGHTIFLSEHAGDCEPGGAVYFWVDDVDDCHRRFFAGGAPHLTSPADTPWGTREFTVIDPAGNRLRFGTDLD